MTRKIICLTGIFLLLSIFIFVACDSFYSNSWGTARKYDPANIDLNADNVDSWIELAIGNPELAKALTEKIKGMVKNMPDSAERAKLQAAGVTLAIEASGLGTTLLSNMDKLSDILDEENNNTGDSDAIVQLLDSMQGDFKSAGGSAAANDLAQIVKPAGKDFDTPPEFDQSYAKDANASDVGQAIMMLTLAVLEQEGKDANVFNDASDIEGLGIGLEITDDSGERKVGNQSGTDSSDEAKALAAYLNLIMSDTTGKYDKNPVTSSIKNAFNLDQDD